MHLANSDHGAHAGSAWASSGVACGLQFPTILLVEDEVFVREVACEILGTAGYRVLQAGSAAEAVRVFRSHVHEVRLLLTDVVLPDRNGCDLAQELAAVSDRVTAVFISGYPENCITREGLQHPGWLYLPKPFSAASLLQKIELVLNQNL